MSQAREHVLFGLIGKWMIARGLVSVAFGIAVVFWPRVELGSRFNLAVTIRTTAVLVLVYVAVQAVLLIGQAVRAPELRTPLLGQAIIAVPAIGLLAMAEQAGSIRAAILVWAVLHGLLEAWIYFLVREHRMSTDFAISAGVHVLLGLAMLLGGNLRALAELGWTGAAATIVGVVYTVGGFTRNHRKHLAVADKDDG